MRNIEHGEKVKDRYGNVYTAEEQVGNTVFMILLYIKVTTMLNF